MSVSMSPIKFLAEIGWEDSMFSFVDFSKQVFPKFESGTAMELDLAPPSASPDVLPPALLNANFLQVQRYNNCCQSQFYQGREMAMYG